MTPSFLDLFQAAHDDHYLSIYRTIDRLSGDPDLAADIAQEAFIRLYRRGSLPDRPGPWLVTVALNLFRNERSKSGRHRSLHVEWKTEVSPGRFPTPAEDMDSSQRRARVRAALDRLPDRDRELLLLRAEGYSYRDLARVLKLNEASVGTILARAKRAFRDACGEAF